MALIMTQGSGMRNPDQKFNIYFPEKSGLIQRLRDFLENLEKTKNVERTWIPLSHGQEIALNPEPGKNQHKRFVKAFEVEHGGAHAMGFSLNEIRTRLNPSLAGKSNHEIREIVGKNPGYPTNEEYIKKLLVYSGDTAKVPLREIENADVLIHDCTFLKAEDRERKDHGEINEVIAAANEAKITQRTLLSHISPRYNRETVEKISKSLPERFEIVPPNNRVHRISIQPPVKKKKQQPSIT